MSLWLYWFAFRFVVDFCFDLKIKLFIKCLFSAWMLALTFCDDCWFIFSLQCSGTGGRREFGASRESKGLLTSRNIDNGTWNLFSEVWWMICAEFQLRQRPHLNNGTVNLCIAWAQSADEQITMWLLRPFSTPISSPEVMPSHNHVALTIIHMQNCGLHHQCQSTIHSNNHILVAVLWTSLWRWHLLGAYHKKEVHWWHHRLQKISNWYW